MGSPHRARFGSVDPGDVRLRSAGRQLPVDDRHICSIARKGAIRARMARLLGARDMTSPWGGIVTLAPSKAKALLDHHGIGIG